MTKEPTLSDKKVRCVCGGDNNNRRILYHEKDLKKTIEILLEDIERGMDFPNYSDTEIVVAVITNLFKKNFGEELLK